MSYSYHVPTLSSQGWHAVLRRIHSERGVGLSSAKGKVTAGGVATDEGHGQPPTYRG